MIHLAAACLLHGAPPEWEKATPTPLYRGSTCLCEPTRGRLVQPLTADECWKPASGYAFGICGDALRRQHACVCSRETTPKCIPVRIQHACDFPCDNVSVYVHSGQYMKRAWASLFVTVAIRSRISKSSSTHPRGGGRAGDGGFSRDPRCRLICLAATFSRNWIPPVSDLSACSEEDRTARGRHAGPRPDPDCTRPDKCAPIRHQRKPCSGPDCANARSPASSFAVSMSSPAGLRSASPCSSTSLDFERHGGRPPTPKRLPLGSRPPFQIRLPRSVEATMLCAPFRSGVV